MENEISIRKVNENDMLTVYEQICELEEIQFNTNDFKKIFIQNINDENILYFIAEDSMGVSLGFISCHIQCLLHHCGKVAEIQELFVKQAYRGQKIGTQMIKFIEEKLLVLNCLSLEVTAQNKRIQTHQFYKKMGFEYTHLKFTKNV
jgi:PhnO protein